MVLSAPIHGLQHWVCELSLLPLKGATWGKLVVMVGTCKSWPIKWTSWVKIMEQFVIQEGALKTAFGKEDDRMEEKKRERQRTEMWEAEWEHTRGTWLAGWRFRGPGFPIWHWPWWVCLFSYSIRHSLFLPEEVPFEELLCWGVVSLGRATPVCRPKGKELERPQEFSLKWYSSATWGEDEIAVKDLFPGWGISFPSQASLALNKSVTWMRGGGGR